MGIVNGIVLFIVIWWVVFFMALPFGVKSHDEAGEEVVEGNDAGAPVKTLLGKKLLVTTGIAAIFWGLYFWAITSELISFYD
jgi:predicted secreted protein